MATIISTTFRLKRGLAEKWQELNLVLDPGEPGFELDTYRLKIGDGQTAWNDLPYVGYNGVNEDGDIVVDTVLSNTSLNPIANKPVKVALDRLEALIEENKANYEFGNGFKVTEHDGIKSVEIDLEVLSSLIDTSNFATKEETRELANQFSQLAQELQTLAAAVQNIHIPTKVSELENDEGFLTEHQSIEHLVTKEELENAIESIEHPQIDLSTYATKEELTTIENKIPSIEGLATIEYVDSAIGSFDTSKLATKEEVTNSLNQKANAVPFDFDIFVGKVLGNFGEGESLKDLTIQQILTKLLALTTTKPETPEGPGGDDLGTMEQIITKGLVMYIQNENGELVPSSFDHKVWTESDANKQMNGITTVYEIVDSNDNTIEAGYQEATVYNEEAWLTVALPDIVTDFKIEQYDGLRNGWYEVGFTMVRADDQYIPGYVIWTVPEEFEEMSGSTYRFVIE